MTTSLGERFKKKILLAVYSFQTNLMGYWYTCTKNFVSRLVAGPCSAVYSSTRGDALCDQEGRPGARSEIKKGLRSEKRSGIKFIKVQKGTYHKVFDLPNSLP